MHCSRAHYIMDRRGIIFIWVSLVAVQYSVHCCEENVRLLNDLELRGSGRQSNFWNGGNDIVLNDADLIPGWYSTTLYGWQYLMTDITSEPNFLKCSTYLPIYLKANHTLVNNLGEDPTDIVACVRDDKTLVAQNIQFK
ncbi:uncharacterized protein LOC132741501 [Ruditapes philippinarum]|uniref:uncharacterized protein LOC132741501 n=1 Tax=Ruditapes philippinarum TaxID=129788 RepID=UPI00295BA251|nr:uncharacterized protein LOC132741501 [Ruditapes philippinarum]